MSFSPLCRKVLIDNCSKIAFVEDVKITHVINDQNELELVTMTEEQEFLMEQRAQFNLYKLYWKFGLSKGFGK